MLEDFELEQRNFKSYQTTKKKWQNKNINSNIKKEKEIINIKKLTNIPKNIPKTIFLTFLFGV